MTLISTKTSPLGKRLAAHLLRRTSYNFNKKRIDEFALKTPQQALAILMGNNTLWRDKPWSPVIEGPFIDVNGVGTIVPNAGKNPRQAKYIVTWWMEEAKRDMTINHKMITFLHQNFMAHSRFGKAVCFYDYLKYLSHYSLGNYKELAKKISLSTSMLMYLNGSGSKKNNPNENYAREYFELFTIGKGPQISGTDFTTYTEYDVKQAAKIFTGWNRSYRRNKIDADVNIPRGFYRKKNHNTSDKTFSAAFNNTIVTGGATENEAIQEIDDLTEMIFEQDATAKNIVRKLYRFFVKADISDTTESSIITPLADKLKEDDYDMFDTIQLLLESEHFYDEADTDSTDNMVGALLKSPKELLDNTLNYFDVKIPENNTLFNLYKRNFSRWMGLAQMNLGFPKGVSGFDGYFLSPDYDKNWYNLDTAETRNKMMKSLLDGRDRLSNNGNRKMTYNVKINLLDWVSDPDNISDPSNAETIVDELLEGLFPEAPSENRKNYFLNDVFLQNLSPISWTFEWQNYLDTDDDTEVKEGLYNLLLAVLTSPEYQTM